MKEISRYMKSILSLFLTMGLFLSSGLITMAQSYDFLSEDPGWVTNSPPLRNVSPHRFYGNANFGSPPHTKLLWHTPGSNAMNQDFIDVIQSYRNVPNFPSWIDISTAESSSSSGPAVTLNSGSCPNSQAVACANLDSFTHHISKKVYTVRKYTISFPNYANYTDQEQHFVLAHELGHVLGLHDKYYPGGYCGPENSVMNALGCHSLTGPSVTDGYNLYKYYEACGGSCASLEAVPSSLNASGTTVNSQWIHRHWYTLMGHIKYYKSNSQNGPWTHFHTQTPAQNLGFWEDAVPQTNDQYILNMTQDVGSMTDKDYVLLCGRPMITWGVWGQEQCMPNAVYVP